MSRKNKKAKTPRQHRPADKKKDKKRLEKTSVLF
jgi:hypothetical protein